LPNIDVTDALNTSINIDLLFAPPWSHCSSDACVSSGFFLAEYLAFLHVAFATEVFAEIEV